MEIESDLDSIIDNMYNIYCHSCGDIYCNFGCRPKENGQVMCVACSIRYDRLVLRGNIDPSEHYVMCNFCGYYFFTRYVRKKKDYDCPSCEVCFNKFDRDKPSNNKIIAKEIPEPSKAGIRRERDDDDYDG